MKKYVKRTVIFAAVVVAVGIIAVLAGLGALGFDVYALDSAEYKEELITADSLGEEGLPADITKISADLNNLTVNFERGDKFAFSYYTYDGFEVECGFDADTGVFEVKTRENLKSVLSLNFFKGIKRNKLSFVFTVPNGVKIDADCSNSSVNIGDISVESFEMRGSNTSVALNETKCENFSVTGSNTSLNICDSTFGAFAFSGSNGALKIYSSSADGAKVTGSNTSLKCNGSAFGTFYFDGSNASIKISDTEIGNAELSGSNANFDVSLHGNKEDYALIRMSGNNASFRFCGERIKGAYKYEGTGEKTFSASGNNASVKLNFEG